MLYCIVLYLMVWYCVVNRLLGLYYFTTQFIFCLLIAILEPRCAVLSSDRVECLGDSATEEQKAPQCIQKGCCYDDMYIKESAMKYYNPDGKTWCFKGKGGGIVYQKWHDWSHHKLLFTSLSQKSYSGSNRGKWRECGGGGGVSYVDSLDQASRNRKQSNSFGYELFTFFCYI